MNKFMKVYKNIISEQINLKLLQSLPVKYYDQKDDRKSKNDYPNLPKNYPLFAVYFQLLGAQLEFQQLYFIPNAAAKKELIKHIEKRASDVYMTLCSEEEDKLYFEVPGKMHEELRFIIPGQNATGLAWFNAQVAGFQLKH